MHDRRQLRDGRRRALQVLRADRLVALRGQQLQREQPQLRLLLRADQQEPDRREAGRPASAAGSAARSEGGREGLRRRLQPVPGRDGRRQPARPALQGQAVGPPDHRARRIPALLPAGLARQPGRGHRRHRGGGAAGPRARPAERQLLAAQGPPGSGHRLERLRARQGRDRRRPRHGPRQPALPLAGLRAPLPDAHHDPGAARRRGGRRPLRSAARPDRDHEEPRLEPHRLDGQALHAVPGDACTR